MATCIFFGHRECYGLDNQVLKQSIEKLVNQGVDTFYVGNPGQFDSAVYSCLEQLRKRYPHIKVCVVVAYLPTEKNEYNDMIDTMYPEIEGHPKFAIEKRNRWLVDHSDFVLCYINHTWGGAYKFARLAERRGRTVINLGNADIEPQGGSL